MTTCIGHKLGLYQTSRQVLKSGKFSKCGLSGNLPFSFLDAGLLTLFYNRKNNNNDKKKDYQIKLFSNSFLQDFFLVVPIYLHQFVYRDLILCRMKIDNLYFEGKMFKIISP